MDVLDGEQIALALFGMLMAVFAWIGRREIKRLDRIEGDFVKRHDLEGLHRDNVKRFEELRFMLEQQNRTADGHRTHTALVLASINTKVAVIRSRMGDNPLRDDSGNYRSQEEES